MLMKVFLIHSRKVYVWKLSVVQEATVKVGIKALHSVPSECPKSVLHVHRNVLSQTSRGWPNIAHTQFQQPWPADIHEPMSAMCMHTAARFALNLFIFYPFIYYVVRAL